MKQPFVCVLMLCGILLAGVTGPSWAAGPGPSPMAGEDGDTDWTLGEVRKIARETGKITIRHQAIPNLDMPPMTMVFQAEDPALLEKFQPGDKIRFRAAMAGGKYLVTHIEPAP